jgi:hypothetical protein
MTDLISAAAELQRFFLQRKWQFCFIGGIAVVHWGEPRLTRDIDMTLLTGFGQEEPFVDEILRCYAPRMKEARSFAIENRILLVQTPEGFPIDIALGGLPFEEAATGRAVDVPFGDGHSLRLCSAEDLVVMKAFAGRSTDWRDIEGIIIRQQGRLDQQSILENLGPLVEASDKRDHLERLRKILET